MWRRNRVVKAEESEEDRVLKAKILEVVAEVVEEVTGIDTEDVTPEKNFMDDLDIDSLSMVEIAVQSEDKIGIRLDDEDLVRVKTVDDAVNFFFDSMIPEAKAAVLAHLNAPFPESRFGL